MNEYRKMLTSVIKVAEEQSGANCYLTGRGLRFILRQEQKKLRDFILIIEASDKTPIPMDFIGENGEGVFEEIIRVPSIEEYLKSRKFPFEKMYMDIKGDIIFRGDSFRNLRTRKMDLNMSHLNNEDIFNCVLKYIREGFYASDESCRNLQDNMTKDIALKIVDGFLEFGTNYIFYFIQKIKLITLLSELPREYYIENYCSLWRPVGVIAELENKTDANPREVFCNIIIADILYSALQFESYSVRKNIFKGLITFYVNICNCDKRKAKKNLSIISGFCNQLPHTRIEFLNKHYDKMDTNLKYTLKFFSEN